MKSDITVAMSNEEKQWGMFCHVAVFVGYVFPLGNILGPLIIWLMKKDEFDFVDNQGKEAINFQITMLIASVVILILCWVLIGFLLLPIFFIFNLIIPIIAIVKSSKGEAYRYPLCIRFIK
ncbi:DUF4870 domain-containing protein [Spartinivicinus ruber]|uniref:DUF4870 domain-containing protein n=1 Tax=Spartinivicinus ruber TaxID=2683272 RepID=UPI001CA3E3B8|nr:DUF4870 domain-containing protein [Spartinivicinus ruber]